MPRPCQSDCCLHRHQTHSMISKGNFIRGYVVWCEDAQSWWKHGLTWSRWVGSGYLSPCHSSGVMCFDSETSPRRTDGGRSLRYLSLHCTFNKPCKCSHLLIVVSTGCISLCVMAVCICFLMFMFICVCGGGARWKKFKKRLPVRSQKNWVGVLTAQCFLRWQKYIHNAFYNDINQCSTHFSWDVVSNSFRQQKSHISTLTGSVDFSTNQCHQQTV